MITLYLIDDMWVMNPEMRRAIRSAPMPARAPLAAVDADGERIAIRADKPSGEYVDAFDVIVSASGPAGEALTVYYTEDGSDPSDRNNTNRRSFETRKTFTIRGNGRHSVLCHAQDSAGNAVFKSSPGRSTISGIPTKSPL